MAQIYLMFSESYAALPPYRDRECGTWFTSQYVCDAATGLLHHITYKIKDPQEKVEKQEDARCVAIVDEEKLVNFERFTEAADELFSEAFQLFIQRAAKNPALLTPLEVEKMYASAPLADDDPLDDRNGAARLWEKFDRLIKDRNFSEQEIANVKLAYQHFYKISPPKPEGTTGPGIGKPSPELG